MIRIVIDVNTPAGYAQAVKEDIAMHLERWGDARVVDVREVEAKRKYFNPRSPCGERQQNCTNTS